jgi:hypothetical protein
MFGDESQSTVLARLWLGRDGVQLNVLHRVAQRAAAAVADCSVTCTSNKPLKSIHLYIYTIHTHTHTHTAKTTTTKAVGVLTIDLNDRHLVDHDFCVAAVHTVLVLLTRQPKGKIKRDQ